MLEELAEESAALFTFVPRRAKPAKENTSKGGQRKEFPSKDGMDWLVHLNQHPFMETSARDGVLGMKGEKGKRARQELEELGYVRKHVIPTGKPGGQLQHYEIIEEGYAYLARIGVKPRKTRGRGGWRHVYWQWEVASWLRREYPESRVQIEDDEMGRVDVARYVIGDGGEVKWSVGYEIHETGSYEHLGERVRKDCEVFDEVFICVEKRETVETVKGRVGMMLPWEASVKLKVKVLTDLVR